jgi:hypothetical protein
VIIGKFLCCILNKKQSEIYLSVQACGLRGVGQSGDIFPRNIGFEDMGWGNDDAGALTGEFETFSDGHADIGG